MSKEVGEMVRSRDTGRGIGADGGSPPSPCRRGGGRGGLPGAGERWSASRKPRGAAVLRGESLEALSREAGVEIYRERGGRGPWLASNSA